MTDWPARARAARYNCGNLASDCLVSERQLQRFFLAHLKKTPKEWMQRLRMEIACDLVQGGRFIKAIAEELCYGGPCQFCREFKKYFGQTPLRYAR